MGKRITQQARGKGSLTFRVRPSAYKHKISYPVLSYSGVAKIVKLFNSAGHTAPLVKIEIKEEKEGKGKTKNKIEKSYFIVPAAEGVYEGQEIYIGTRPENKDPENGDVVVLKDIKQGTKVFNVETVPGNGGKILRSGGSSGVIMLKDNKKVEVLIRRRKLKLNENSRAVIGVAAGDGRKSKPLVKAGKQHHRMKAQGRKWHRTSAIKTNAIDHPFGGGRGKRIKSKIAKRNSPPGLKVGHIRPRRTGRK
jgi:large subunit ribosomal protein L2